MWIWIALKKSNGSQLKFNLGSFSKVDTFDEEHLCGRYVLLEKIGGGSYGSVTKMEDVDARRQSHLQSQAIENSRGMLCKVGAWQSKLQTEGHMEIARLAEHPNATGKFCTAWLFRLYNCLAWSNQYTGARGGSDSSHR